jgi:hypothetical protein
MGAGVIQISHAGSNNAESAEVHSGMKMRLASIASEENTHPTSMQNSCIESGTAPFVSTNVASNVQEADGQSVGRKTKLRLDLRADLSEAPKGSILSFMHKISDEEKARHHTAAFEEIAEDAE